MYDNISTGVKSCVINSIYPVVCVLFEFKFNLYFKVSSHRWQRQAVVVYKRIWASCVDVNNQISHF